MQVADQQIVGHRVGVLGVVGGLAVRGDDAFVDLVQCAQVRDRVGSTDRVVIPGACGDQGTGCALRGDPQGGDAFGERVDHGADGIDLRVEHQVYGDEVWTHDIPVDVLEGQRQVVQGVQPPLEDLGDLGALRRVQGGNGEPRAIRTSCHGVSSSRGY